jgi:IS605 OrfB family transposase
LGLNNLATVTFKDSSKSYIIDGKIIKSENRYYNNRITKLQQVRMKQVGSDKFKDTKKNKILRLKRRNFVTDYLHKASRKVIDLANKNKVGTIIIGDISGIKQNNKQNKHFVALPIQRFKDLIEYKAKLEGIKVIFVNEAYTSGCTKAFDLKYAM